MWAKVSSNNALLHEILINNKLFLSIRCECVCAEAHDLIEMAQFLLKKAQTVECDPTKPRNAAFGDYGGPVKIKRTTAR